VLPEPLPTLKGTAVVFVPAMRAACHVAPVPASCEMAACVLIAPVPVTDVLEVGRPSKVCT
jgi:hypothetical protein